MRRSLKDEADKELQFLVRKFNEMAPQIQKDTKHGQCPHTAETTYQEMKRVMKETKNPNPIKYWELARINDKGAHYAVMFLPKKDAIKEGAVSEWNTLPLGDANSKITKKFPYGVVLESSMLEGASLGTGKPPILLPTTEAGPSGDMEIGTSTGLARQVRYGRSTLSSTARATGPKDPRI
ncbi:MAG: hypothetical protein HYU64_11585 [Armatimonadetes bacterium]|nr:hypothetical protein [Armatimonadota bacterium]